MDYEKKIKLQNKAMRINIVLLVIMAVSAYVLGVLANSEAIKFDGLFTLVTVVTVIVGIHVNKKTLDMNNKKFPLGKYRYNTISALIKTFTLLILVSVSSLDALTSMFRYFVWGYEKEAINFYYANIYYAMMFVLKISSIGLYSYYLKKIPDSNVMRVERMTSIADGLLTFSIFLGLTFFTKIDAIAPVADDLVLFIITLYLIYHLSSEFFTLSNSLIGKRTHFNQEEKLTKKLKKDFPDISIDKVHVQELGDNYSVTLNVTSKENKNIKKDTKLMKKYINNIDIYQSAEIIVLWGE